MTEAEKQALAIYESMVATSKERPSAFRSVEQWMRETTSWKAKNPALAELERANPQVLLAFLGQCNGWLRAEAHLAKNYNACLTLSEGIQIALSRAPRPLPQELVRQLLAEYGGTMGSMAHMYFPISHFLSQLSRDQVSDDIRSELRKLYVRVAPSPSGKIEQRQTELRDRVAELMRVEGERPLDPGRGPWSQIVFDETHAKEEITRAGWDALLDHCRELEQSVPGAKWKKKSRELISALGEAEVFAAMLRWLALGPTPGQPSEARSPIEDSSMQRGVVWCLSQGQDRLASAAIADFGIACLRKVPSLGAVSQKVGFACVQALGAMECGEAVMQLTRLRSKVKYTVARRLIEKSLRQAAERNGLTLQELEDISVGNYGLDAQGVTEIVIGGAIAIAKLGEDGRVKVAWRNPEGKAAKSAPSSIKKSYPKQVRSVSALAKELEQVYLAQRSRLEESFVQPRGMPIAHWRKYFIEHPLLGFLGRRLIWAFRNDDGWERSGISSGEGIAASSGNAIDLGPAQTARLWHPLASDRAEIQGWRESIFALKVRQPFRQAFREFYQVTDAERETRMYSNRFAGILMRQHQFASLCRARGWDYRLMGTGFDGSNVPAKNFESWNVRVEFYVDLPPDRDPSLLESAIGEQSGAGINLFIGSDQVRFYRDAREIAVDDVPAILYSEVMRDIDLFTSVCAVGEDESWTDQGDRGTGFFTEGFDLQHFLGVVDLRREMISLCLQQSSIQDRTKIHESWLEARGRLGTYRIEFAWGGAYIVSDAKFRFLRIPSKILDAVSLDLTTVPIDLDYRTEMILRKAYLLADDWKIDSPDLIKQLMPE